MSGHDPTTDKPPPQRGVRSPHVWVTSTYFAEGFPYALVNNVADLLFLALGASVKAVGLTAIFHLPWNLKFLWAPLLDQYETKRRFLIGCEVVVLALVLVLAVLGTASSLALIAFVFVMLGVVSATHDIAIDGYYMEALDARGQSSFVGYRAAAYRGAVLLASGPLLMIVGAFDWRAAWLVAALIVAAFLTYHILWLPQVERVMPPLRTWLTPPRRRAIAIVALVLVAIAASEWRWRGLATLRAHLVASIAGVPFFGTLTLEGWIALVFISAVVVCIVMLGRMRRWLAGRTSSYARGFVALLDQPGIDRALAFVVLFRAGESFLMKMRAPFLRNACGLDEGEIGFINGTLGWSVTLVATLLGGWLIGRHGVRRWMWPFVLAQNVPNLAYAWAAASGPASLGNVAIAAVVLIEDFGAGLGTAFFIIYLMRCVDPRHKATHMAVLTAIMSLGFTLAGVASGFLAEAVGYPRFFVLTFVATLPSMAMVRWVPYLDRTRAEEVEGDLGPPQPSAPVEPGKAP